MVRTCTAGLLGRREGRGGEDLLEGERRERGGVVRTCWRGNGGRGEGRRGPALQDC